MLDSLQGPRPDSRPIGHGEAWVASAAGHTRKEELSGTTCCSLKEGLGEGGPSWGLHRLPSARSTAPRAGVEEHFPTLAQELWPHHSQPRANSELLFPTTEGGDSKEKPREVRKQALGQGPGKRACLGRTQDSLPHPRRALPQVDGPTEITSGRGRQSPPQAGNSQGLSARLPRDPAWKVAPSPGGTLTCRRCLCQSS